MSGMSFINLEIAKLKRSINELQDYSSSINENIESLQRKLGVLQRKVPAHGLHRRPRGHPHRHGTTPVPSRAPSGARQYESGIDEGLPYTAANGDESFRGERTNYCVEPGVDTAARADAYAGVGTGAYVGSDEGASLAHAELSLADSLRLTAEDAFTALPESCDPLPPQPQQLDQSLYYNYSYGCSYNPVSFNKRH